MKELTIKQKENPIFNGMPKFLKDPANFDDIRKQIFATVQTTCSHASLLEYASCKKCTEKMLERRRLLKNLGFKNPAQYMEWQKVHLKIKETMPLVDWKKKEFIWIDK